MKAKVTTDGAMVSYSTIANHISTAVSEQPDFLSKNCRISKVSYKPNKAVENADGSINTGHYANWLSLAPEDRKRVNDERARLGLNTRRGTTRGNGPKSGHHYNKPHKSDSPNLNNQLYQLKKANEQHKRTIASLRIDPAAADKDIEPNAGDAFGGEKSKK